MSPALAGLLVASLVAGAEAEMPADFLKVESKAWSRWLDGQVNASWTRVSLKEVLAYSFGPADLAVDNAEALDTPITLDAEKLTRRAALWRLGQRYGFTVRWEQEEEPKVFLDVPETQERKQTIGGYTITKISEVMRSDYGTYQDLKQAGRVTKEQVMGDSVYYAINVYRDLRFDRNVSARVILVERYKATVPADQRKPGK